MAKDDLNKVLFEIEKMGKQNKLLKSIKDDDEVVVERAMESMRYMETLNDKQLASFKKIQLHKPEVAILILKMNSGAELTAMDTEYLKKELHKNDDGLVSSKHLRLTLLQEALLGYFAKNKSFNHSDFIREIYFEKMNSLLKDVE